MEQRFSAATQCIPEHFALATPPRHSNNMCLTHEMLQLEQSNEFVTRSNIFNAFKYYRTTVVSARVGEGGLVHRPFARNICASQQTARCRGRWRSLPSLARCSVCGVHLPVGAQCRPVLKIRSREDAAYFALTTAAKTAAIYIGVDIF